MARALVAELEAALKANLTDTQTLVEDAVGACLLPNASTLYNPCEFSSRGGGGRAVGVWRGRKDTPRAWSATTPAKQRLAP